MLFSAAMVLRFFSSFNSLIIRSDLNLARKLFLSGHSNEPSLLY